MPKWPERKAFSLPRLIVCEGASDEAFLRALSVARGLPKFHIRNGADISPDGRGGIDKIGLLLRGMATWPGFRGLREILIVADNDRDPPKNFQRVCDQIATAAPDVVPPVRYGVPSKPLEKAAGEPANITILMLPQTGQVGHLESLCLRPALDADRGAASCVEEFARCTQANNWPDPTKLPKMKLRALLAARHIDDPFIGLGRVWNEASHLIPLSDPAFEHVAEVLRDFQGWPAL